MNPIEHPVYRQTRAALADFADMDGLILSQIWEVVEPVTGRLDWAGRRAVKQAMLDLGWKELNRGGARQWYGPKSRGIEHFSLAGMGSRLMLYLIGKPDIDKIWTQDYPAILGVEPNEMKHHDYVVLSRLIEECGFSRNLVRNKAGSWDTCWQRVPPLPEKVTADVAEWEERLERYMEALPA